MENYKKMQKVSKIWLGNSNYDLIFRQFLIHSLKMNTCIINQWQNNDDRVGVREDGTGNRKHWLKM